MATLDRDHGEMVLSVPASTLPALYDEYFRKMVKLASIYVDDRETAEEVVQDAFVKLLAGKYRIEPGKEAPYLRQMVLNGARSMLRKRRVRRLHNPEPPGTVAAAEEFGVGNTERARMLEAVRRLPEKQASVLILRYYLDQSEAEIAETLGIARGSVKSHAHRGLSKLQKILKENGSPEGDPRKHGSPEGDPRKHGSPEGGPRKHGSPEGGPRKHGSPEGDPRRDGAPGGEPR